MKGNIARGVVFAISHLIPVFLFAEPSIRWEPVNPFPHLGQITCVAYGDGKFVAMGDAAIGVSTNLGRDWHRTEQFPRDQTYSAILHANGQFVAVGSGDKAIVSTDGRIWTAHTITNSPGLLTLSHFAGLYIATGLGGVIATSTDGREWQLNTSVAAAPIHMAAVGNGRIIAAEGGSYATALLVSTNGLHWDRFGIGQLFGEPSPGCLKRCPEWVGITGLAFGNGMFMAHGNVHATYDWDKGIRTLTSSDGLSWTNMNSSGVGRSEDGVLLNDLDFVGGLFISKLFRVSSRTGESWTSFSMPDGSESPLADAVSGAGVLLLAGGYSIAVGEDLHTLERINSEVNASNHTGDVAANGGVIVAFGSRIGISTNAVPNFRLVPPSAAIGPIYRGSYGNGVFVGIAGAGLVARSTNGLTWSKRLSNTSADLMDLAYGDGQWVVVGANGTIISSPDASMFTLRQSGTALRLNGVAHGAGKFVAVGDQGLILSSIDGVTWTQFGTDDGHELFSVAFGNGRFVAVGENGAVHVSTNAVAWTRSSSYTNVNFSRVVFAQGMFMATPGQMVGEFVYTSIDGIEWTRHQAPRQVRGVTVSDGTFWLIQWDGPGIWRAAFDRPRPELAAALDPNGKLVLKLHPAEPGTYELLSTLDLSGDWKTEMTFNSSAAAVSWTDSDPQAQAKFFVIVRIE